MMIDLKVMLINIYSLIIIVETLNFYFKFRLKKRDLESV